MKAAVVAIATSTAVVAAVSPAEAWSPRTRARMARDAIHMMPRSLRTVLEHHDKAVLRGMLEPMAAEDDTPHRPPWDGGTLPAEVARRSEEIVAAVDDQRPFSEVAFRLGGLAHFVADAGFPPTAGADGDDGRYRHFAELADSRLEKIRFVFYGHDDPQLAVDDVQAFVLEALEAARANDRELARAYRIAGDPPNPSAFDDRSVPFAIASLAYSRTVTGIVRAWMNAWARAHGDLGRTPYLERPENLRGAPPR